MYQSLKPVYGVFRFDLIFDFTLWDKVKYHLSFYWMSLKFGILFYKAFGLFLNYLFYFFLKPFVVFYFIFVHLVNVFVSFNFLWFFSYFFLISFYFYYICIVICLLFYSFFFYFIFFIPIFVYIGFSGFYYVKYLTSYFLNYSVLLGKSNERFNVLQKSFMYRKDVTQVGLIKFFYQLLFIRILSFKDCSLHFNDSDFYDLYKKLYIYMWLFLIILGSLSFNHFLFFFDFLKNLELISYFYFVDLYFGCISIVFCNVLNQLFLLKFFILKIFYYFIFIILFLLFYFYYFICYFSAIFFSIIVIDFFSLIFMLLKNVYLCIIQMVGFVEVLHYFLVNYYWFIYYFSYKIDIVFPFLFLFFKNYFFFFSFFLFSFFLIFFFCYNFYKFSFFPKVLFSYPFTDFLRYTGISNMRFMSLI